MQPAMPWPSRSQTDSETISLQLARPGGCISDSAQSRNAG